MACNTKNEEKFKILTVEEARQQIIRKNPNLTPEELTMVMNAAKRMAELILEFGQENPYHELVSKIKSLQK